MMRHIWDLDAKGFELQRSGQLREAIAVYQEILRAKPDYKDGFIHHFLGQAYEDIGDFDQAERYFKEALSFDSESVIFLAGYASFLSQRGRNEEAFDEYLKLLHAEVAARYSHEDTLTRIKSLGKSMLLSDDDISAKISEAKI